MPLDYAEKYDVANEGANGILSNPSSALLATGVDVVTSIWNSLPLTPEVSTRDILGKISDNALAVFDESPDAIRTASLVGGSLIPAGLYMNLMKGARAGTAVLGYAGRTATTLEKPTNALASTFLGTRQTVLEAEIENAFRTAGTGTTEFKNLKRQLLLTNIAQGTIDNTLIEIAVIGTMNAHPYMEDYKENPLKNFTENVILGAGLGGALAIPLTNRAVRDVISPLGTKGLQDILQDTGYRQSVTQNATTSVRAQAYSSNIKVLDNLALDASVDPYHQQIISGIRLTTAADRDRVLLEAFPFSEKNPEYKGLGLQIINDPKFTGVDKIVPMKFNVTTKGTSTKAEIVGDFSLEDAIIKRGLPSGYTDLVSKMTPQAKTVLEDQLVSEGWDSATINLLFGRKENVVEIPSSFVTPAGVAHVAVYRASSGELFSAKNAAAAAHAVDIPGIQRAIKSPDFTPINFYTPKSAQLGETFASDNLFRNESSAMQNARFIHALDKASKLPEVAWDKINLAPDDLPGMNGIFSLFSSLDAEKRNAIRIQIRSDLPLFQAQKDFVAATVSPTHISDARKFTNQRDLVFLEQGLSKEAQYMLGDWVHGSSSHSIETGKAKLRRAMDSFLHGVELPNDERGNKALAREIWNSGDKYRQKMRTIADADGYVYMYRGSTKFEKSSTSVASFTPVESVTPGFGTPRLYKIKVDNIIGTLGSGPAGEAEVLVASAGHTVVQGLPIGARLAEAAQEVHIPGEVQLQSGILDVDSFYKLYANETQRQIKELASVGADDSVRGFSREEIAARLAIKPAAVEMVLGGQELSQIGFEWRQYTDPKLIDSDYLNPKNRMFGLVGSPLKAQRASDLASLDAQQIAQSSRAINEQYTLLAAARGEIIGSTLLESFKPQALQVMMDDVLGKLGQINNATVARPFLQSADHVLRNVDFGHVLTGLGKTVINTIDKTVQAIVEPVANAFLAFEAKPAVIAEYSLLHNKVASLKGWVEVDIDVTTGKGYLVQKSADGRSLERVKNTDGSEFIINQREVLDAIPAQRIAGQQLLQSHNLVRETKGQAPLNDRGLYFPPTSLVNKSHALIIDPSGKEGVQVLVAANDAELQSQIAAWKTTNKGTEGVSILNPKDLVTKGEQADYNLAKNYIDAQAYVTYANVAMEHTGASALAIIPGDARLVTDVIQGFENQVRQVGRQYAESYFSDITQWLDRLSDFYQRSSRDQPRRGLNREVVQDAAMTAKNVLLGRDQLEQSVGWKAVNDITSFMINRGVQIVDSFVRATPFDKTTTLDYYNKLNQDLKTAGVPPIWKSFNEYLAASKTEARNAAPAVIAAGQGLLSTVQLRMGDLAYPLVNLLSLPILTYSSLMQKLPGTPVDAAGNSVTFPLRIMMNAMQHMFSPEGRRIEQTIWEPRGLLDQTQRQFTDVVGALHQSYLGGSFSERAIATVNGLQNNTVVKNFLAKPADWAEKFTRRFAMHVGYLAAKTAHEGIDDIGATITAMNMADRVVGNYHAAQKPILFQGTAGSAISLYQTYFLTFAQHVYTGLEERNFKQLASLMMTQAGIFGMASLPGYNLVSENLVANMNDKHYDITTGTYRALGDKGAEIALYGLPSSIGPALYTRGDIQPRIPSTMGEIALFSGVKQAYSLAANTIKGVTSGLQDGNVGRNMMEALSLQSLNRPIARFSELATGTATTGQHSTVSNPVDVWTPNGVFSRMLATRPLEEQTIRNAEHLHEFYDRLDHENRQHTVDRLKVALRAGNLTDEMVSSIALDYLKKNGTSQGWNSVLNNVMLRSSEGTRLDLLRKLEPDSPLRQMIQERY